MHAAILFFALVSAAACMTDCDRRTVYETDMKFIASGIMHGDIMHVTTIKEPDTYPSYGSLVKNNSRWTAEPNFNCPNSLPTTCVFRSHIEFWLKKYCRSVMYSIWDNHFECDGTVVGQRSVNATNPAKVGKVIPAFGAICSDPQDLVFSDHEIVDVQEVLTKYYWLRHGFEGYTFTPSKFVKRLKDAGIIVIYIPTDQRGSYIFRLVTENIYFEKEQYPERRHAMQMGSDAKKGFNFLYVYNYQVYV